jgi:hypothetical protein
MGVKNDERIFHTIYSKEILKNMKHYYGIDSDNELVKYIRYVRRNHVVEADEVDGMQIQKVNKE